MSLINDETGASISISGELSDEEVKVLEAFIKEADEVWQTDFIQTGEKGRFNIKFNHTTGTEISTVLPEWNQVVIFLHKFRPILGIQKECGRKCEFGR